MEKEKFEGGIYTRARESWGRCDVFITVRMLTTL